VENKIYHKFRNLNFSFMLEHSVFVCYFCFYFICFCTKCYLEKKTEKNLERKKEKEGSPPCRPGGPASPWFLPQPAAQLAAQEEQARAPLPSLSLLSTAGNQAPPGSSLLFFLLRS